jgi:dihydroorotate dehydrogenase electron transfer subunit
MKKSSFEIISNEIIAKNTFRMRLSGDISAVIAPGQFVNIELPGFFLRRPISVCDAEGDVLTLIYKVVGTGTEFMSELLRGRSLDLLTGLGNGFDISGNFSRPLLLGGGAGAAPLYYLAKKLCKIGKTPSVILGFNSEDEIFLAEDFSSLGCETVITTADGSKGVKGFAPDGAAKLSAKPDYIFCCGPKPMLRAVYDSFDLPGQYSFEERMGCGFGACMGCSMMTSEGAKRVCRDGPVFNREVLLWD